MRALKPHIPQGITARKNIIKPVAIITAAAIEIALTPLAGSKISSAIERNRLERLSAKVTSIYTSDYQQSADNKLAEQREKSAATLDDPFTKVNPYGTNTTSLYVYFTTDQATNVSYTIHVEGYPDFTATANQGEDYSTTHEFVVLGLIPKKTNIITLTLASADGHTVATKQIKQKGPALLGEEETQLEQKKQPTAAAKQSVGDGLYAILGNDSDDQDFMYYYDVNGVLRGEIPVKYYRSHRLVFGDDGLMWFSASTHTMVGINRLGKLEKIFDLDERFILHHDYALDSDGNLVLLATDLERSDHAVQDQVVKLDTTTGKTTHLLDLGTMFADYKKTTTHSGIDESDTSASDRWDWIHCNTIQLLDDGSAILSARETSTIIKIADIEGTPTLQYMIGEPSVWDGTQYQSSFLTKDGDFRDTGGQHSVTYSTDDSLEDGSYYLTMFDNSFGYAMTRPDYDWSKIGLSTAQSAKDADSRSKLRKYLVDEKTGTYTEVNSFEVPYSPYVSPVQEIDDDLNLVDSGMQGLFGMYDADGTLQAQYAMRLASSYIYRVHLYDFQGFYFA